MVPWKASPEAYSAVVESRTQYAHWLIMTSLKSQV